MGSIGDRGGVIVYVESSDVFHDAETKASCSIDLVALRLIDKRARNQCEGPFDNLEPGGMSVSNRWHLCWTWS